MNKLLARIESIKKKVEGLPKMVEESCIQIANKANSSAPKDVIVFAVGNTVTAEGTTDKGKAWAAYTEFGTGQAAAEYIPSNLPIEWDEYAYKFYETGKGNTPATPYLFPAFEAERIELIKKIKESFKNG